VHVYVVTGRCAGVGSQDDFLPSYFNWEDDDVFIPHLRDEDEEGNLTTDRILHDDGVQVRGC
jgi:hypothetical protein